MKSTASRARGQLVADFLAGSWRPAQTPLDLTAAQFETVVELLYHSGGVGLAWWRIQASDLTSSKAGELIHQAYRLQALQSAVQEERTIQAFRLLRDAGIEPILMKGWAVARHYPQPMLRAYGDIDLLVRPEEYRAARQALGSTELSTWWVDLHRDLSELEERPVEELFERSRAQELHQSAVRVLGPEDSLALLAIHLWKHGAWRPSWLCDISVVVEALPADFDWKICFGSHRRRSAWIGAAIFLAHKLLGTNIERVPLGALVKDVPDWLVDAVLTQWGSLIHRDQLPVQPRPLFASSLSSPRRMIKEIIERWPDPVTATFNLNGRMSNLPRFPYQLGAFALTAGRYFVDNLGNALSKV
jgi:Uncharacterised nucleotidyltransferase